MSGLFCGAFNRQRMGSWLDSVWKHVGRGRRKQLQLADLPDDVLRLIINEIPFESRLSIRAVSHQFHDLSDIQPLCIDRLGLWFTDDSRRLQINSNSWSFNTISELYTSLSAILTLPNLRIDTLNVEFFDLINPRLRLRGNGLVVAGIRQFFATLPSQLYVQKLEIHWLSFDMLEAILPFLQPTVLTSIEHADLRSDYFEMVEYSEQQTREIFQLEQWKKTKNLRMDYCMAVVMDYCGDDCFEHFETIDLFTPPQSIVAFPLVKEVLRTVKHQTFLMTINTDAPLDEFCRQMSSNAVVIEANKHVVYTDGNHVFDVGCQGSSIVFKRRTDN